MVFPCGVALAAWSFGTAQFLLNFLNQPETWFASLVQPQAHECRMAFPKTNDGDSLAMHTACECLSSSHGSRRGLIRRAQRRELIFIIYACQCAARRWKDW